VLDERRLAIPTVSISDRFVGYRGLVQTRPKARHVRPAARLVHAELTTERIRAVYANRTGHEPAYGVAVFDDAMTVGKGYVRVADGRLVEESIDPRVRRGEIPLDADWLGRRPVKSFDTAVFVGRRGECRNYGHFLVEVLPRLVLNAAHYPADARILLYKTAKSFAPPLLRAAGIAPSRVSWIVRQPVHARTMYWLTPNTRTSHHHSADIYRVLRDMVGDGVSEPPSRLLYISRRDAARRRLVNDDAVGAMLEARGFEHVSPSTLTFADEVRTFAEARMVVSVCGAELANTAFMPSGGSVVMLTPAMMPGAFYWETAHHRSLAFTVIWGPLDDPAQGVHGDFSVDCAALERIVDSELNALVS
jgi:hypothetical protein